MSTDIIVHPGVEKKAQKYRRRATDKIKFSIGAKMIIIITIIVLLSLGSITALVSWLFYNDLRIAAEENNFEANRRSAMEAESTFTNVRANTRLLVQTVTAAGLKSAITQEATASFFEENSNIAAVFFTTFAETEGNFMNSRFFDSREIDSQTADMYVHLNMAAIRRAAAGETIMLNGAPHFGISILAMFFPWKNGGTMVLFSPANLNDTFGFGTNQSYLLNDSDDVLIHPDFDMVRSGVNMADNIFPRYVRENASRNSQTLYTNEYGVRYFAAFTKLNIAGVVVISSIEYNKVFEGIFATIRRNLYLTGAVLSVSIILIWFFAKTISVPLKALAAAARTIEGGVFETNL